MRTIDTEIIRNDDELISASDSNWAFMVHLSGLCVYVGLIGFNVLIPAVIYFLKRKESNFIAAHAKQALNLNLTFFVIILIALAIYRVLERVPLISAIAVFALAMVGILVIATHTLSSIKAMLRAKEKQSFQYLYSISFFK